MIFFILLQSFSVIKLFNKSKLRRALKTTYLSKIVTGQTTKSKIDEINKTYLYTNLGISPKYLRAYYLFISSL